MKIDSQPFSRRIIFLLILGAGICLILWILPYFYRCPFYFITGIPCPGCGITRGASCLLRLDFWGAWKANPCVYLVALYAGLFVLAVLWGKTFLFRNSKVWWIFSSIFLGVYLFRMILYFPHTPPMTFDSSAIIPHIFTGFSG